MLLEMRTAAGAGDLGIGGAHAAVDGDGIDAAVGRLRFRWARRLLGRAAYLSNALQIRRRHNVLVVEVVHGTPLVVMPGVFNPLLMRTGAFFASQLTSAVIGPHATVLDLGTGSGVCAVAAARHGRRVIAVDISSAAVRCARVNALLNGVDGKVEVRHGDLFEPVGDERFDVVLFNPPFVRGTPADDLDRAWRSDDVAQRFAAGLAAHLNPGGCALVLLSTFGDPGMFVEEFRARSFRMAVLSQRRFLNERLTLLSLRAGSGGTGASAGAPVVDARDRG